MQDISSLSEEDKIKMIKNRWESSQSLWDTIEQTWEKNFSIWKGNPEWNDNIPRSRATVNDNRAFLATEAVLNNLTGRPSKPNAIAANETPEAKLIADNLQEWFLAKYKNLQTKKEVKKSLRGLFFSRVFAMKYYWDTRIDDYGRKRVDPRKIRIEKTASSGMDSEFAIEEITKPIVRMIELFPEAKKLILQKKGYASGQDASEQEVADAEKKALLENPDVTYYEAWIDWGAYRMFRLEDKIIKEGKNPFWDWNGLPMTEEEKREMSKLGGAKRRTPMRNIKNKKDTRQKEVEEGKSQYQNYLFNHFDNPRHPYIVETILEVDESPAGETSLIEQAAKLQEAIDRRKRQISDNADFVNGVWKFDTEVCTMSRADANKARSEPGGMFYGDGVSTGITRESGTPLPSFVMEDLANSITELDALFGTQPTFRGEGGQNETATGRAILREQAYARLDELIDLVDNVHQQLYDWEMQMMRVRYTESHLTKPLGSTKASQVIELTQDDLQEGIEIQVIPGQVLPEDRFYQAERAQQAAESQLLDPLSYFEATGWDDPMKQAKRLVMYTTNPFSIIDIDDKDIQALQRAAQLFNQTPQEGQSGGFQDPRARRIHELSQALEQLPNTPEFQQMEEGEQQQVLARARQELEAAKAEENA